ncbi:MAG TPA: DUF898 family protein [Rhabdaerophilum sp.]|nr:DUF898 family protein [Rhabdaerophilum sp.]
MHVPTIERTGDAARVWPAAEPRQEGVRLEAVPASLAWHVIKGIALTIITFGIYRFWYRTALRRYYWNNTRLAGDRFEYTGTGKELFIGFLIAIAIVIPIYLVVTLVGLVGGAVLGPVVASILGALIMPAVVQVLSYRARRYRLLRTRYRGLRFHQTGTGIGYLLRTLKWMILTGLTLGIIYPYLRRALERYKIEHTWYGSARGSFSAPVKPMMKLWLLMWGLVVGAMIAGSMVSITAAMGSGGGFLVALLGLVAAIALLPIVWQAFRVREFRAFVGGTKIGDVSLSSDLKTSSVIWVWISYYLMLIGLFAGGFALASYLAVGRMGYFEPEDIQNYVAAGHGQVAIITSIVAVGVASAIVTELFLRRRLWALRARSITVHNLASLDQVLQSAAQEATGVGEAFDSGFDIAG